MIFFDLLFQRFGGEGGTSHGGDQIRFLRDELNTMENQITALTKELKEKDLSLREEKESSERVCLLAPCFFVNDISFSCNTLNQM